MIGLRVYAGGRAAVYVAIDIVTSKEEKATPRSARRERLERESQRHLLEGREELRLSARL